MEDQRATDAAQAEQERQAIESIPPALLRRIIAADALLLITITPNGGLETAGIPKHPPFQPGLDASHAMLQAIKDERPNLLAKVRGDLTDGDRYRALRAFGTLAQVNPVQFEAVNAMFLQFEERVLPPEGQRTSADHDKLADFLLHALIETTPGMTAPTTAPDAPALVLVK